MSDSQGRRTIRLKNENDFNFSRNMQEGTGSRFASDSIRNNKFRENHYKQGTIFPQIPKQESSLTKVDVKPISISIKKELNRTNNAFSVAQQLEPTPYYQSFETERKKHLIAFKLNKINQDQKIYQSKLYDYVSSNYSRNQSHATESQLQNALSTMYSNGKRHKISKNYEYAKLFEDSSLSTTTLRKERMYRSIERMKQKAEKIKQEGLDQQKKSELIKFYQTQFGITLSPHQMKFKVKFMEKSQLEVMLEEKLINKRQQIAAVLIQKVFKGYMIRRYMQMLALEREKAVRVIQGHWRRYARNHIAPRRLMRLQGYAAVAIQKFMRKYLVQKKLMQDISQLKISLCYEYFNNIRNEIYEDSAIKIAYQWRRYAKRKKVKEELKRKKQQQIDAQKKKNKVNNFRQKEKTSPMNKMKNLGTVMATSMASNVQNMMVANEKGNKNFNPAPQKTPTIPFSTNEKTLQIKVSNNEDSQKSAQQSKSGLKTGKTPERMKANVTNQSETKFTSPSIASVGNKHSRQSSGFEIRRNSVNKQPLKFGETIVERDRQSFDLKEELKSDNDEEVALRIGQNEIQEITQEGEDELMENEDNNSGQLDPEDQEENQS